jgi:hypothetical protein
MAAMTIPKWFAKALPILMLIYGAASLIHFIHNAEFLRDYPGLPVTWTRAGVYAVWLGMTGLGIAGWLLFRSRFPSLGLLLVCVYAAIGMDSLGHYVVASFSAHTAMMNLTILLEVTAAAAVLATALTLLVFQFNQKRPSKGPFLI